MAAALIHVLSWLLLVLFANADTTNSVDRSEYVLQVSSSDGSPIKASIPTLLCVDVTDATGRSLLHPLRLHQLHSRLLHIVLIPATYSSVLHVHIEDYPRLFHTYLTSNHCAAINVTLPSAGRWVVGVNVWATEAADMVTVSVAIDVVGGPVVADFAIDTGPLQEVQPLPLQRGQSYTAAVQRSVVIAHSNRNVIVDVQLDREQRPIKAGTCCALAVSVSTAATNEPVDDLLPLLTLPAHLFLFHYNSSTHEYYFHHLHAHSTHQSPQANCLAGSMDGMAGMLGMEHMEDMSGLKRRNVDKLFGPMVEAGDVQFDCAGRWLIIGQLRRASEGNNTSDGELLTVMVDVNVE